MLDVTDVEEEIEDTCDEEVDADGLEDVVEDMIDDEEEVDEDEEDEEDEDKELLEEDEEEDVEGEPLVAKTTPTSAATRIMIITTTDATREMAVLKRIKLHNRTLK